MSNMSVSDLSNVFDERPWGCYRVLDEAANFKVKHIEVKPGQRLSYQKHVLRSEHWMIVQGVAIVVLDGREIILKAGDAIDIPMGAAHRIANSGKEELIFIEVQRGSYFGEDDIVRLQDGYGRLSSSQT